MMSRRDRRQTFSRESDRRRAQEFSGTSRRAGHRHLTGGCNNLAAVVIDVSLALKLPQPMARSLNLGVGVPNFHPGANTCPELNDVR